MTKQDLRNLIWELPELDLSNPEDREILYTVFEPLTKGYFQDAVIIPSLSTGDQAEAILRVLHLMPAFFEVSYSEGKTRYLVSEELDHFVEMCKQLLHTIISMPEDGLD